MEELKNLIPGCKHKSLLSKHFLCTGPYCKHFLWVNLLTSPQFCEADGYHPGFADDETEHREVEKVSQGHTAWEWQSWDFNPGKLSPRLCSL